MTEYITKAQALSAMRKATNCTWDDIWNTEYVLNSVPAADVAPVAHGKWEDLLNTDEQGNHYYWCTNCHTVLRTLNCNRIQWFSFCPNCGAKMKIPDNVDPAKAFPERNIDDFEKWNKHIPQEVLDEIRKVVKSND